MDCQGVAVQHCNPLDVLRLRSFDLLHVMIDETSEGTDSRIAQHIIRLHRFQVSRMQLKRRSWFSK
jgi:DNA replicative helicase MCM subunit Mcm2 (Cdc46/Mcm family)